MLRIRPTSHLLAAGLVLLAAAPLARAEKPNLSPEALERLATHVVVGTVVDVYEQTLRSGGYKVTKYVAEVRVLRVEKGEGLAAGAPLYARYWTQAWVGPGAMPPGTTGHRGLPTVGQTLRLYLARHAYDGVRRENDDGGLNVIGANGFQPLAPGETVEPPPAPAGSAAATFPEAWRGTWKGELRVHGAAGSPPPTAMEIVVEPAAEGRWRFAIRYGEQPVRDYVLVPRDPAAGAWAIDEGNSIVLPASFLDGELFSAFSVEGALITARYRLDGDVLRFDLTQVPLAPTATSGGEGVPGVGGHEVRVVQRAALRR